MSGLNVVSTVVVQQVMCLHKPRPLRRWSLNVVPLSPVRCVQSSILGHLEALRLLGRGRCFVEFGAGRGKLSHWIHEALKTRDRLQTCDDLQLLLVERCSTRFKAGKNLITPTS